MFYSPIKLFILASLILICVILAACGFIDLRQIQYSVEPNSFDSLLEFSDSPLIINFDTEMIKRDAEGSIQVSSDLGAVRGDTNWQGNSLYFVPVSGWTAGIRYTLSINGTLRSTDGRDLRLQHFVSFYAINKITPPLLERHYPAEGEAINTNDFALELHFTVPMNRLSVESAVSIDGVGSKIFEWQDDDKTIRVIADRSLSAWTSYTWNIKESAKSIDGVPLPKQYSGSFTTNLDLDLPEIAGVYPVASSYGNWSATGKDIENGLALGEGIAVEFSKPMGESVLRSMRFEPSLTGRTEMLDENKIVYIFTRNPEPETVYTLIISGETRDSEGLKIGNEYRVSFLPDIPYLNVISFNDNGNPAVENLTSGIILPVRVEPGIGEAAFSIRFSLPLNNEEKQNITQRIILSPFFPRSASPVALQFVSWVSDDRIFMRWEGLKPGDEKSRNYYRLTIPGGRGGITSAGIYMKEDINIYLEAVNEN